MLYRAAQKEAIEVVPPGTTLDEAKLRELAAVLGSKIDGIMVERVVVVFIGGSAEAIAQLAELKRFGLTVRAIDEGKEVELSEGAHIGRIDAAEGTLLPILREQSWPHLETTLHRRLLEGQGGPWVTYGWDSPKTVTRFGPQHLAGRERPAIEAEALKNLKRKNFAPDELEPGVVIIPGEYCSEALLLPDVMRVCQRILGAKLIAVAVPKEHLLMCVDAAEPPRVLKLMAGARAMFDEATGRRISPLPFLVGVEGTPVGFAAPVEGEPAPAKKPWYKFW